MSARGSAAGDAASRLNDRDGPQSREDRCLTSTAPLRKPRRLGHRDGPADVLADHGHRGDIQKPEIRARPSPDLAPARLPHRGPPDHRRAGLPHRASDPHPAGRARHPQVLGIDPREHADLGADRHAPAPDRRHVDRQPPGHAPGHRGCTYRSLPDRQRSSPFGRRVDTRITRFDACSAFTHVPARTVAEPPNGGPLPPRCFSPCRHLHEPPWLLPTGATVVGRDLHPLKESAFPRRTANLGHELPIAVVVARQPGPQAAERSGQLPALEGRAVA